MMSPEQRADELRVGFGNLTALWAIAHRRRQSEAIIDGLRALVRMTDRPGAPTGLPDFLVIEVRQRYGVQTAYNHRKISTRVFDLDDMAIVLADAGRMMDAEMLTFLGLLRQDRIWAAKPGWMSDGKVIW